MRSPTFARLAFAALSLSLLPDAAAACSTCAGREDGGLASTLAVGAIILFPFAIAAVVTPIVRRSATTAPIPDGDDAA